MRISVASEPGSPEVPNEDWAGVSPSAVVVLDGVTVPPVMAGGCIHGTPWYVRQLGSRILRGAEGDLGTPLPEVLAAAIRGVADAHRQTCELSAAGAPSAAVAAVRLGVAAIEYLVLADVTVAVESAATRVVGVITDDRVAASVAGVDAGAADVGEQIAGARAADRNRPGGYWVAAADPEAAGHAVTGFVPLAGVSRVALLTDGAARAADMFGWPWGDVLALGAGGLIAAVRETEASDPGRARWPRFKVSDDATAVIWQP